MRPVSILFSLYISTAKIWPNQLSHSHVLAPSTRRIRTVVNGWIHWFREDLMVGSLQSRCILQCKRFGRWTNPWRALPERPH